MQVYRAFFWGLKLGVGKLPYIPSKMASFLKAQKQHPCYPKKQDQTTNPSTELGVFPSGPNKMQQLSDDPNFHQSWLFLDGSSLNYLHQIIRLY